MLYDYNRISMICSSQTRRGRPRGRRHDAMLYVRLPADGLEALKDTAAQHRMSVSALVRGAIVHLLAANARDLVTVAKDKTAPALKRMAAAQTLNRIAMLSNFLGPRGTELARKLEAVAGYEAEGPAMTGGPGS